MEPENRDYIINLELEKFKYFPGDVIEGNINLKLKDTLINKNISEELIINYCLIENIYYYCEKEDYTYETVTHFNDNKIYEIKKEEINYDYLIGYSIAYGLIIPFQFKIPSFEENNDFHPTFRFVDDNFQCFVSHKLIIEIKNKSNKISKELFIKKTKMVKDNNSVTIFKDEMIKKYFLMNIGRLSYYILTVKSCSYNKPLPVEIHIDKTEIKNIKIKAIELSIKKNITIKEINFTYNKTLITKQIKVSDDLSNTQFKEYLPFNKKEFSELNKEEFEKELNQNKDDNFLNHIKKYNFSPPLDNTLFKCSYMLTILIKFEETFINNRIVELPIDYYDEKNEIHEENSEFQKDQTHINDKELNKSNALTDEGFTLLTKEDFMELIDGKMK